MKIAPCSEPGALGRLAELAALFRDAVEHGASIGYTLPLGADAPEAFWRKAAADVTTGQKLLWLALADDGKVLGSAQLALEARPNGRHRAEVQKVLVFHAARGRGVGAALMAAVEAEARRRGRTLLFLDTSVGAGGAAAFYRKLGYTAAGGIPDYAADPDGTLAANAIFYKKLA